MTAPEPLKLWHCSAKDQTYYYKKPLSMPVPSQKVGLEMSKRVISLLQAAVSMAFAQSNRSAVLVISDGILQFFVQRIYLAIQHKVNVICLVPRNEG